MRDYIIQCDSLTTWPALIVFSLLRASFMGQSMPVSVAIISRYARFVDCGQSVAFSDGLPYFLLASLRCLLIHLLRLHYLAAGRA
jgi:hypothetical protein